jgi:peptidoglycan-associated lipoprotein
MRRLLLIAFTASTLALVGCKSTPKNGECKTSADCAGQQGFGTVCVTGRCVECAVDADCSAGFTCQANKCAPKPAGLGAADTSQRGGGAGDASGAADAACADPAAFTVHFGFDQYSLGADATGTLQKLAACLQKSPAKKLGAAGHCDDRGTTAYNMALGKKRAEAVAKYLKDLGVAGPVETNTFGKEKPVCRETTEDCWARNRRAELQIGR